GTFVYAPQVRAGRKIEEVDERLFHQSMRSWALLAFDLGAFGTGLENCFDRRFADAFDCAESESNLRMRRIPELSTKGDRSILAPLHGGGRGNLIHDREVH